MVLQDKNLRATYYEYEDRASNPIQSWFSNVDKKVFVYLTIAVLFLLFLFFKDNMSNSNTVLYIIGGVFLFAVLMLGKQDTTTRLISDEEAKALVQNDLYKKQRGGSSEFGGLASSTIEMTGLSCTKSYDAEFEIKYVGFQVKGRTGEINNYVASVSPYFPGTILGYSYLPVKFYGEMLDEPHVKFHIPFKYRLDRSMEIKK